MGFEVVSDLLYLFPIPGEECVLDELALEALLRPVRHLALLRSPNLRQLDCRAPHAVDRLLLRRTQLLRLVPPVQRLNHHLLHPAPQFTRFLPIPPASDHVQRLLVSQSDHLSLQLVWLRVDVLSHVDDRLYQPLFWQAAPRS